MTAGILRVVVVSAPLTPGTRGLIGAAGLSRMRPTAVPVNVGRGPVVDEDALYRDLSDRAIGGAALDVWYRRWPGEPTAPLRPRRRRAVGPSGWPPVAGAATSAPAGTVTSTPWGRGAGGPLTILCEDAASEGAIADRAPKAGKALKRGEHT